MKARLIAATVLALSCASAFAAPTIVSYDLAPYNGDGTLEPTFVAPGFSASPMSIVGLPNSTFSNHFYTSGWDSILNPGKFFTLSLSATSPFTLDKMLFSIESTTANTATVIVRSSVDSFSTDLDSFTWASSTADVTNGDFDFTSLGVIAGNLTLRFYFLGIGSAALGFANHEPPGTGSGLPDIGRDISFTGNTFTENTVPEPASLALLGLGLIGLGLTRRRKF